jgi:hypothetical protein
MQRNGMVIWDKIAAEVAKDFPDVMVDKMLVDAMTGRRALDPKSLDTTVATNLVSKPMVYLTLMPRSWMIARRPPIRSRSRTRKLHWYRTGK